MTEVECKLCKEKISFDINSPNTYIQKDSTGNSLIGNLYTVRVSHKADSNSLHINVVVVDENGEYRAHKDYYQEKEKIEGLKDVWEKFIHQIPLELRYYMQLSDNDDKEALLSIPKPYDKPIEKWEEIFEMLKEKGPENQFISFIFHKWKFIIGKDKEINKNAIDKNSWSYPIFIRLKARYSPSPKVLEEANNMNFNSEPTLIQLEEKIARAEVYLRMDEHDLLERLYKESSQLWGKETAIGIKSGFMMIQSYYSFSLNILGKSNKALSLVEPAFNFGQIIENRELICIAGNFFAAILQSSGDYDKSLKIYKVVLDVSRELGDSRTEAVVSINISIIESKQGLYDKALKRQLGLLESPLIQEEYFLRSSLQSIITETLFIAERYEESQELCKKILEEEENISTYYKSQVLSVLKRISGKTSSPSLLEYVRDNLLKDKEFLESPTGHIFHHDLKAIDAELNENWLDMTYELLKEREIMFKNDFLEDASDIEIRLAQAYFELYKNSEDLEYLNKSYSHIDLASTIASENQNYLVITRLITLKGLLALESGLKIEAKHKLEDALEIAQNHNLTNVEKNIKDHLHQLSKGKIENSTGSVLKRLFRVLTFRKAEQSTQQKESIVYSIWICRRNSDWNMILQNKTEGSETLSSYFEGFCDSLMITNDNRDEQQPAYYSLDRGDVLIEKSKTFQLIALCSHLDYLTRLTLQKLLPSLEEFPFKHIPEKISEKVIELVNNQFTGFDITN